MRTVTTTLAASALLVAGGAAGAALSAGLDRSPAAAATPAPAPVEVRTQVIHRTVHVVRHIKPKRVERSASPPAPPPVVLPARAQQAVAPVPQRPARALRTGSSATGHGGDDDREHEGGGDD
jgi:hypothetical protein